MTMGRREGLAWVTWVWRTGCVALAACGGAQVPESQPLLFEGPFDPNHGASSILMHRPLPVGTRMRTEGLFRYHHRTAATSNGFLVNREDDNLQLAYDVAKTVIDVDLDGNPIRVRYAVSAVQSSDADIAPLDALVEGRAARLHESNQVATSGGQVFDLAWDDAAVKVSMVSGALSDVERKALTDPLGPAYEFNTERRLAHMFGPQGVHREGEDWEIDLELAAALLSSVGTLEPPLEVSGRATFASSDDIAGVPVQRIQAWARAEGTLAAEFKFKTRAKNASMELRYSGAFPVNLNLPPLEHDWTFTGKAELIVEVYDRLGEVRVDTVSKHQSRITQITR